MVYSGFRMILCMPLQTDQNLRALRSLIDRVDLSLRAAAKLVGIDNTVLTDWYNGTVTPKSDKSLANLDKAIRVLGDHEKSVRSNTSDEDVRRVGIRLIPVVDHKVTDERLRNGAETVIEAMDWGTNSDRKGFVIPDDAMHPDLEPHVTVIADDGIPADPNLACLIETSDGERMVRWSYGVGPNRIYQPNDPQYPVYPGSKATLIGVVVETRRTLPGDEESRHLYPKGMRRRK